MSLLQGLRTRCMTGVQEAVSLLGAQTPVPRIGANFPDAWASGQAWQLHAAWALPPVFSAALSHIPHGGRALFGT